MWVQDPVYLRGKPSSLQTDARFSQGNANIKDQVADQDEAVRPCECAIPVPVCIISALLLNLIVCVYLCDWAFTATTGGGGGRRHNRGFNINFRVDRSSGARVRGA